MPFDYALIAITLTNSEYSVHSSLSGGWLDLSKLPGLHQADVSADNIYQDFVAPLATWQARRCLPDRAEEAERISKWLDGLPDSVIFILMHRAEFELFGSD